MKTANIRSKILLLLIPLLALLPAHSGLAREKWPQEPESEKKREAAWKQHEQEVLKQIQPELEAWAKKGKPFLAGAKVPADLPQATVPAFPGAEGAGKFTFGGRGGKVLVVTSLDDSGPGTLREAVESAGPRTVVFNVAGIIHLKMPLYIKAPYLTIAGQTAPGDGVCVAGETTLVDTHDVVIRYMRFRRGNTNIFDRDDALGGNPIGNIVVDHCSCSWGLDENLSMYRHMAPGPDPDKAEKLPTLNISMQWNITSEAFNDYNHAFGGIWGGNNCSFHHNLLACNTGRNASIGMGGSFNFINNVIFNWRHRSLDGGDASSLINCINNYYKPGPATSDGPVRHRVLLPNAQPDKAHPNTHYGKAYVAGNVMEGDTEVTADNWNGGVQFDVGGGVEKPTIATKEESGPIIARVRMDKPFPMAPVPTTSAKEAYDAVLDNAGATLPRRDPVDTRIITEVRTGKTWGMGQEIPMPAAKGLPKNDIGVAGNGIVTDVAQVGGYPEYKGEPVKDLGADGIPLSWKKKYQLDASDASLAQKDLQGDGYTVLEKYLNRLDPTKKIDWSDPKSNLNLLAADK